LADTSFRVWLGISSTEATNAPDGPTIIVRTNFAAAFRALVPDGGGLVVANTRPAGEGTNYLFVLSLVMVDAMGKPIRLAK
jgi:hypothetical protein